MSTAPLLQAILSPQDRAELLRDLDALVQIHSVQVEDQTGTRSCRLDEAFAAMELGTGRRALIRYRHDGRSWMDTLLRDGEDVRLVRVAEDEVLPPDATPDVTPKSGD